MSHKIAVITVVYQNYGVLKDFFASFERQNNKNFHIFISDLSEDKKVINTIDLPSSIFHLPNKGYAHGVNLGLKKAIESGYDKFCVINSDVYVNENFVNNILLSIVQHPSSILGGKIYYAPGYEFHKSRYKKNDLGKILWYAGGEIDWENVFVKHRGVDQIDHEQYNRFSKTDFVTGCLMVFDKSVIDKSGFWNEKYFLYFEDADFCQRAKRKGIKLYYDPSIVIWHKNAQSTEGSGSKLHQKYQKSSRLSFALKYAPLKTKLHVLFQR